MARQTATLSQKQAKVRRKRTRGWLPLQRDHRTKLGWDWLRRVRVVRERTWAKAEG